MFVVPKLLLGKWVLIVDDEVLVTSVTEEIEDILTDCGCITAGPCGTVEARHALQSEAFDAAILTSMSLA